MTTDTAPRSIGYAQRAPIKPAPWHALVAWDMFFNGMTAGLFLVAALGELAAPQTFAPLARVAYPVALGFLLADLLMLVLDLGDPFRFHHMLRVFKPGSPMSLGVWSLTVYSLPLTVAAVLSLQPGGTVFEWIRRVAVVLGLLPALVTIVYKGVLLSTSAQLGWRDARWMGGFHASGAVLMGCAQMALLASVLGSGQAAQVLRAGLGVLVVVHAVPSILVTAALWPVPEGVESRRWQRIAAILLIAGGLLLPLILVMVSGAAGWLVAAAILILLSALGSRFLLIYLPHYSA
jgi:hypothetical protein